MVRCAWVLALLVACGTTKDDRPRTISYVTEAILAPTCGGAECHSTFAQNRGDVFDTVKAARKSLVDNGLISFDSTQYDPAKPSNAALIVWLTQIDPFGLDIGRMPYDAPMPNADINFLEEFIREQAPGAQCDPANGLSCNNMALMTCTKDWNFDQEVVDCAGAGNGSACAGGQCLCKDDFADCDANPMNGCETATITNTQCGSCSTMCTGDKSCEKRGTETTHSCECTDPTKGDCDNNGTCETAINTNTNCGACGNVCGTGTTCMPGTGGTFSCQ
jgi:hypothetical protein